MPPESLMILATATLAGIAILGGLAAWSWSGWLRLKMRELEQRPQARQELPAIGQRIDLADLKERIRKLEAIAAGVDL
ncbi:MAG: hypothetical protein WCO11_07445 [Sphingomonadales bacterium]|jgi:hypothetical protein